MTYLYILILTTGMSSDVTRRFEFPTAKACDQALQASRLENKKETTVIMFCANEKNQRHYQSTWWTDKNEAIK